MKRFALISVAVLGALALSACGKSSLTHANSPDEFAISRSAPLVVPPDFALAPPRPGQPRPLDNDSQKQALEALFGSTAKLPPKSAGEISLLDKAGANKPDVNIRSIAGDPGTPTVDKGAFLRELLGAQTGDRNAQVATVAVRP